MIEQNHFSHLVKLFLERNFPEFVSTLKYKEDGSFDSDLRNPTNLFSIWIATYDSEITVGIEDPNGKTDIHSHISCYDEKNIEDALNELSDIINKIQGDKLVLYNDKILGYNWTEKITMKKSENTKVFYWSGKSM